MKLKSFMTATLAIGVLATGGVAIASNEVSAAQKDNQPATQKLKILIMYHIQLLLMARLLSISHILSSKNSQLSYLDLGNKVKAALNDERGVTSKNIRNAKSAVYTITWKDGSKKEVDLMKDSYPANLFDASSIKQIDINVKTK